MFLFVFLLLPYFSTCQSINLIIDTDGLFDDIRALTLALNDPSVNILAITTVHGGLSSDQSAANVARVLKATNNEHVPIYIGANDSLVPKGPIEVWTEFFGEDGIGNVPNVWPQTSTINKSYLKETLSGVDAIIELTKTHENVRVVCLGSLTNIALALDKDPNIKHRIGELIILGGNWLGVGNTRTNSTAEFNFLMDPEAAKQVLATIQSTIIPFDTIFLNAPKYAQTVNFEDNLNQQTQLSHFLNQITLKGRQFFANNHQQYTFVDDVALGIAIDRAIITECRYFYATVELEKNSLTRGQVVIDWMSNIYNSTKGFYEAPDGQNDVGWLAHKFVTQYDAKLLNDYAIRAVMMASSGFEVEKKNNTDVIE